MYLVKGEYNPKKGRERSILKTNCRFWQCLHNNVCSAPRRATFAVLVMLLYTNDVWANCWSQFSISIFHFHFHEVLVGKGVA